MTDYKLEKSNAYGWKTWESRGIARVGPGNRPVEGPGAGFGPRKYREADRNRPYPEKKIDVLDKKRCMLMVR
jgi:hypothetical protein